MIGDNIEHQEAWVCNECHYRIDVRMNILEAGADYTKPFCCGQQMHFIQDARNYPTAEMVVEIAELNEFTGSVPNIMVARGDFGGEVKIQYVPENDGKADAGKLMAGCLMQFKRALMGAMEPATLGAKKYDRGSWVNVPDAEQRYEDGFFRHLFATNLLNTEVDQEGVEHTYPHDFAALWNLLAVIELRCQRGYYDGEKE